MNPAASIPASLYQLAKRFWQDAAEVDATGVLPSEHLDLLAGAGLYGIFAPASAGGLGLRYEDAGLVVEELASACLATTFVWIQHFTMLRALLDEQTPTALRTRLLPGAIRGEIRAGVVLAGLLPGPPRLRATLTSYGWLLDGEAPWVTGWGHVGLLLVTARGPGDGTVVTFLVDAREQPGLTVEPMRLAAVNASATVRLGFSGLPVPDDRYIGQYAYDPARYQHEGLRLNGSLALGVARRCCALIGPSPLDDELRECRAELDGSGSAHMPAARARASEFAVRAAHALAVWQGSGSALAGHHAERLTREAAFLLVFGSRPTIKAALLRRLGAGEVGGTIGDGGCAMKLKLDLHDIYNRGGDIDRALRAIIDEAVRKKAPLVEIIPGKGSGALKKHVLKFLDQKEIKALYHRVEKDSKNFGRVFVHFRW